MVLKSVGERTLKAGKKSFKLRLSIGAMIEIEEKFNRNIALVFRHYDGLPPFTTVCFVFSKLADLTMEEAAEVMFKVGLSPVAEKCLEVITAVIAPEGEDKGEE